LHEVEFYRLFQQLIAWKVQYLLLYYMYYILQMSRGYSFRRFRKIAKTDYQFVMSVCPYGITWLSLDGFSLNFVFDVLKEISHENSSVINHLTPNVHFSGRTAPLTYRCCFFLFIQQIYVLNILNMLHTLRFFLFKTPFIS
jgi:hypothetical protein